MDTPTKKSTVLSDFFLIENKKRGRFAKKLLRFNVTLTWQEPEEEPEGLTLFGCLAFIDYEEKLAWTPPLTRMGFKTFHNFKIHPGTYNRVLRVLSTANVIKPLWDDFEARKLLKNVATEVIPEGESILNA